MAKISNLNSYPQISSLDKDDYLLITDKENALQTKNVSVEQLQAFFGINTNEAKVTISSASLLTLATTPVELVAAPGASKVIDVISIMFYLDAGTTVYDFGTGALPIKIGSEQVASVPNSGSAINSATDAVFKPEVPTSNEIIAQNTALTLEAVAPPTQGNGVLYANVFYRILNVGSSF